MENMSRDLNFRITEKRIIYESMDDELEVHKIVQTAKEKGWTRLKLTGDLELRKAVWLEASLAGLAVEGYLPTASDREQLAQQKKNLEFLSPQAQEKVAAINEVPAGKLVGYYSQFITPEYEKKVAVLRKSVKNLTGVAEGGSERSSANSELNQTLHHLEKIRDLEQAFKMLPSSQKIPITREYLGGVLILVPNNQEAFLSEIKRALARSTEPER